MCPAEAIKPCMLSGDPFQAACRCPSLLQLAETFHSLEGFGGYLLRLEAVASCLSVASQAGPLHCLQGKPGLHAQAGATPDCLWMSSLIQPG